MREIDKTELANDYFEQVKAIHDIGYRDLEEDHPNYQLHLIVRDLNKDRLNSASTYARIQSMNPEELTRKLWDTGSQLKGHLGKHPLYNVDPDYIREDMWTAKIPQIKELKKVYFRATGKKPNNRMDKEFIWTELLHKTFGYPDEVGRNDLFQTDEMITSETYKETHDIESWTKKKLVEELIKVTEGLITHGNAKSLSRMSKKNLIDFYKTHLFLQS